MVAVPRPHHSELSVFSDFLPALSACISVPESFVFFFVPETTEGYAVFMYKS